MERDFVRTSDFALDCQVRSRINYFSACIAPPRRRLSLAHLPLQIPGGTRRSRVTVTIDATIFRNVTAYMNDPRGCDPAPAP